MSFVINTKVLFSLWKTKTTEWEIIHLLNAAIT